jgi:cellulose synthase/poly-beta-1,6-N-acetylglucosamine synthase-like glycosyltransferase
MSYMHANYVAPGPFSVYKTAIVRELGGFDEDNLVEDQEIAYRAQLHHYKLVQVPKAVVRTVAPYSLRQLQRQRNRWFKGSLLNIIKYRRLVFNRKYGDFGVFQMPLNITAFVLGLVAFFSFLYYTIRPVAKALHRYWLVGFDLLPYLRSYQWHFDPLSIQVTPLFILYLMLALSVVFLYLSSRANGDRVREYGWLYIVPYFFLYFLILSFVTVRVIVEVAMGKKQKW